MAPTSITKSNGIPCNLRCVFCQNWDISQQRQGWEMTGGEIADLMLALQEQGCHNVNFVTPEHVVPQVIEAIAAAVPRGLRLSVVYNTSAYDALPSLRLMEGLVDIYMPDFKFLRPSGPRRSLDPAERSTHRSTSGRVEGSGARNRPSACRRRRTTPRSASPH